MNLDKIFVKTAKLMKKYSWLVIWWDKQINKVISNNKKLVIIYGHPLCIPCKKIFPQIIPMYIFYKFKWYNLKFANVKEACEKCVKENNITTTPTMVLYHDWKETKRYEDNEVLKNLYKI